MAVDRHLMESLRETLARFPGVRLAMLFGSRATGRERPDSDVDLAVVCPEGDRYALASALTDAIGRDVDLVDLSRAGVPLLEEVLRDGVLVHEGERGAAARWLSHTMLALELDRRWYRSMRDAWLARVASGGLSW